MVTFSEAIQTLSDKHQSNNRIGSYVQMETSKPETNRSGDTSGSTVPPTVLVIDDDASILHMMTALLEDQKYYVFSANNGNAAIEVLKEIHVDLVVTDIIMPGMEGLELIRSIKKSNAETKIIAMSGFSALGQLDYLGFAKEFGVDHTFQKPFNIKQFLETVKDLISQKD